MIKIFAKKSTSEKVLVVCSREEVPYVQRSLSIKMGGDWILVDKLDRDNLEVLIFDDGLIYQGFHAMNERYCRGIMSLKK